jgi:hypothetical protein
MFGPSLREAVEEEPEVLALEAAVEALDLSGLEAQYARVGHPAYPPAVMLKVLVYGYLLGLRASRHLAPLVEQVIQACGAAPEKVVADGSYANSTGIAQVEAQGVADRGQYRVAAAVPGA